jgi:hypothetical protein
MSYELFIWILICFLVALYLEQQRTDLIFAPVFACKGEVTDEDEEKSYVEDPDEIEVDADLENPEDQPGATD